MRRLQFFLLLPALAVLLGVGGANAQQAAPTSTVAPQQWSSRIVNSDEIDTIPVLAVTTTTKAAAKKARVKSPTTTTIATPGAQVFASLVGAGDGGGDIAPEVWLALRKCESGNRYDLNTGNGYFGAYQFALGTWQKLGYPGLPHQAPPSVQDEAARRLQARSGWAVWPSCSRRIGAR